MGVFDGWHPEAVEPFADDVPLHDRPYCAAVVDDVELVVVAEVAVAVGEPEQMDILLLAVDLPSFDALRPFGEPLLPAVLQLVPDAGH